MPTTLRHALVRDVFFSGPSSLPVDRFLPFVPNQSEFTKTIIGAKGLGASVADDFIMARLDKNCPTDALLHFAALGPRQANWVLQNHADSVIELTEPLLYHVPQRVIPVLLNKAIGDPGPLNSHPNHPLRILATWVKAGNPRTPEAVGRRQLLLTGALTWLRQEKDQPVGLMAVQIGLSSGYEEVRSTVGSGHSFTVISGPLTPEQIKALHAEWPRVKSLLVSLKIRDWAPIIELIVQWAYPGRVKGSPSPEILDAMRQFARQLLHDVAALAQDRPGVLLRCKRIAGDLKFRMPIRIDPDFEILFPNDYLKDWRRAQDKNAAAARKLAQTWLHQGHHLTASRLVFLEREATMAAVNRTRYGPYVCKCIAEAVKNQGAWISALLKAGAGGDVIEPFLSQLIRSPRNGDKLLSQCLTNAATCATATASILQMPNASQALLNNALAKVASYPTMVQTLVLRDLVPDPILKLLFRHKDSTVAGDAAIGYWHAEPVGEIASNLRRNWESALVRGAYESHTLQTVFVTRPTLAERWLLHRFKKNDRDILRTDDSMIAAMSVLSQERRLAMLPAIPPEFWWDDTVRHLVGDDDTLYREMLAREPSPTRRMAPLEGDVTDLWVMKAIAALDAGIAPRDIAVHAIFGGNNSWVGEESTMWSGWIEQFVRLESHADSRIREIGRIGVEAATEQRDRALRNEQHEAVHGRR
jgi:hypothetical protein